MFMSKQMVLKIFIISVAFGAKAKLQIGIVLFCASADRAFMLCDAGIAVGFCLGLKLLPSSHLCRGNMKLPSGYQHKNHKVKQRSSDRKAVENIIYTIACSLNHLYCKEYGIGDSHPLHLHRDHKHQKNLGIREGSRIG